MFRNFFWKKKRETKYYSTCKVKCLQGNVRTEVAILSSTYLSTTSLPLTAWFKISRGFHTIISPSLSPVWTPQPYCEGSLALSLSPFFLLVAGLPGGNLDLSHRLPCTVLLRDSYHQSPALPPVFSPCGIAPCQGEHNLSEVTSVPSLCPLCSSPAPSTP